MNLRSCKNMNNNSSQSALYYCVDGSTPASYKRKADATFASNSLPYNNLHTSADMWSLYHEDSTNLSTAGTSLMSDIADGNLPKKKCIKSVDQTHVMLASTCKPTEINQGHSAFSVNSCTSSFSPFEVTQQDIASEGGWFHSVCEVGQLTAPVVEQNTSFYKRLLRKSPSQCSMVNISFAYQTFADGDQQGNSTDNHDSGFQSPIAYGKVKKRNSSSVKAVSKFITSESPLVSMDGKFPGQNSVTSRCLKTSPRLEEQLLNLDHDDLTIVNSSNVNTTATVHSGHLGAEISISSESSPESCSYLRMCNSPSPHSNPHSVSHYETVLTNKYNYGATCYTSKKYPKGYSPFMQSQTVEPLVHTMTDAKVVRHTAAIYPQQELIQDANNQNFTCSRMSPKLRINYTCTSNFSTCDDFKTSSNETCTAQNSSAVVRKRKKSKCLPEKAKRSVSTNLGPVKSLENHVDFSCSSPQAKRKALLHDNFSRLSEKKSVNEHPLKPSISERKLVNTVDQKERENRSLLTQNQPTDDYKHIQSPEKYTDCMLSSSLINNVYDETCDGLMNPTLVTNIQTSGNDESENGLDLPDFASLDSCSPEENVQCELFGGGSVVEPSVAVKRTSSNPDVMLDVEKMSESCFKKQQHLVPKLLIDDQYNLSLKCEQKLSRGATSDDVTTLSCRDFTKSLSDHEVNTTACTPAKGISSLVPIQNTFSMLTSVAESTFFQKEISENMALDKFLREYTDVRIGACKKCIMNSHSVVSSTSNKVPETLTDLLAAVFCHSSQALTYQSFIEITKQRLQSMEEEIATLEKTIQSKNPHAMQIIRFGPESESNNMRKEVEDLARRCKSLAKACWKASKSKLNKCLRRTLEKTMTNALKPLLDSLKVYGHPSSLLQEVINESEAELLEKKLLVDETKRKCKESLEELQRRTYGGEDCKTAEAALEIEANRASTNIRTLKKFILWDIVKEDASEKLFGFLQNSLLLKVSTSTDGLANVLSYQLHSSISEQSPSLDIDIYHLLHKLIQIGIKDSLETSPLLKLHQVLHILSMHAAFAQSLRKEILETASCYSHCALKVHESCVTVNFFARKPNLCNFQVKFLFAEDLHNMIASTLYRPLSFSFLRSSSTFGKFNEEEVMGALNQVPSRNYGYFTSLVKAVISLIEDA